MPRRILPALLLLSAATPALAQQPAATAPAPDSLYTPPIEAAHDAPGVVRVSDLPLLPVQERLRQVAGVQVTPYSGAPGSPAVVRVRGAGSVVSPNARPLYVVDGIPQFMNLVLDPSNSGQPLALSAELSTNPLLALPAASIESVEVLKGALATARYGLYGQNGVVLIRTRQGAAEQPLQLQYQGFGTVGQPLRRFDLLTARQFAVLANEAALSTNRPPVYSPEQVSSFGQGTDWQREVLRPAALGQQHHLSASGGSAHGTRYYAAADYLGQQGVVREAFLRRYALRLNVSQQLSANLRLDGRLAFSKTDERRPLVGVVASALTTAPTLPVRDTNGQYTSSDPNFYLPNPTQQVIENYRRPHEQRLSAQLGATYQLGTDWQAELRGALEHYRLDMQQYSYFVRLGGATPPAGPALRQGLTYRQWVVYPALRYHHTRQEQHAFTAALEGQLWLSRQQQNIDEDYGSLGYSHFDETTKLDQRNALLTAGYTYAGRYELQASLRADRVAPPFFKSYWWWLPGAQATWHAAQEAFLAGSAQVSTLDAWVGWGRTGTGSTESKAQQQGFIFYTPTANRTTQTEIGTRLGLWHDALTLTASVYRRYTAGMLPVPITPFPGQPAGPPALIEHQVRNRGVELTVQGQWQAGGWQLVSRAVAAYNANRYTDSFAPYLAFGDQRAGSGQPVSTFYGLRYQPSVVPTTGQFGYQDLDGDGRITPADRQALGTAIPPQLLSLSQEARSGRWSFSLQLDGMFGQQVYNPLLAVLDAPTGRYNSTTRALDRWTPASPNAEVPRAGTPAGGFGDYQLQPGGSFRITAAQVGYRFWRSGTRSASVWVAGHNLLVLSRYRGIDPNISSYGADPARAGVDTNYYPVARTVALGVSATL